MKRLHRLFVLGGLLIAAGTASALPLGRLFFSPEQRAELNRERQAVLLGQMAARGPGVRVNGIVIRSDGRNTVWVNQQAQQGKGGGAVGVIVKRSDRATLRIQGRAPRDIRVGEAIDPATGTIDNGLDGHGRAGM